MHHALSTTAHQQICQQLLAIVPDFAQIYQEQWQWLHTLHAERLYERVAPQTLALLDGWLQIRLCETAGQAIVCVECCFADKNPQYLVDFFLTEVAFLTGDGQPQHSLFLKTKAQRLRQAVIEQVFIWIDGEARVETFFQNMTLQQAQQIDQLMITAGYYAQPYLQSALEQHQPIPLDVMMNFKHMCLINSVLGDNFLPVQHIMPDYDRLCLFAKQWLGARWFRVLKLLFPERFTLQQCIQMQDSLQRLLQLVDQHNTLLGFVLQVQPQHWSNDELLAKKHFLTLDVDWWLPEIGNQALFQSSRAVNWLYKQDAIVLDWISQHLSHTGVRYAVTACSFLDTRGVAPQVILLTLRHFQHVMVSLWLQRCRQLALQEGWFEHPDNQQFALYGQNGITANRRLISPSALYLQEWWQLLQLIHPDSQQILKQLYQPLSRIMQAYMQHVQEITHLLPIELLDFLEPRQQQDPAFFRCLQQHQLDVSQFRQRFYLQEPRQRQSLFSSYVCDYLETYLDTHPIVPKNVTWTGLFRQAVTWHQQMQRQNMLTQLVERVSTQHWAPLTQTERILWGEWSFEELHSIERIIQESQRFQHCLALSYSQRIVDGTYVAFHMRHRKNSQLAYTLGCHYRAGVFEFDQLELPRNQKADHTAIQIAERFVVRLNAQLHASR